MAYPALSRVRSSGTNGLRALRTQQRLRRPAKPRFMQEEKPLVLGLTATQIFGLGVIGMAVLIGFLHVH